MRPNLTCFFSESPDCPAAPEDALIVSEPATYLSTVVILLRFDIVIPDQREGLISSHKDARSACRWTRSP